MSCWGLNSDGQLGDGTQTDRTIPVSIQDLHQAATGIGTGTLQTCVLLSTGRVFCFGYNGTGDAGPRLVIEAKTISPVDGADGGPTRTRPA